MDAMTEPPLTPNQVAERWQCETQLVYRCCKNGTLKSFRIGKLLRIRPEWVEECEQCQIIDSDACTANSLSFGRKMGAGGAIDSARASRARRVHSCGNLSKRESGLNGQKQG